MQKKKNGGRNVQKIVASALAIFLALTMLVSLVVAALPYAQAATTQSDLKTQISTLQKNAQSLKAQKQQLNTDLETLRNDKQQALQAKNNLDLQMVAIEQEIQNIQAQIQTYEALIVETEKELETAKQKEKEQEDLFCARVREMEENGTVSYWAILFEASSFSDLVDRAMVVSEVMEYDNQIAQQLKEAREAVEAKEAELKEQKAAMEAAQAAQEAAKVELEGKLQEATAILNAIQQDEAAVAAALQKIESDQATVSQSISARERELAAMMQQMQQANPNAFVDAAYGVDAATGFYYPLPSNYTRISSGFGYRIHPITGRSSFHGGVDLPAPSGTPVYSVKSGIVAISGYNSSYGNYVVIQHTNGYSSLYAHLSSRCVSANQTVAQGQAIGGVGTTGSSTGNHLHFEIRVNGNKTNPCNYYSII